MAMYAHGFVWRCCVMKRNVKSKSLRCVTATNNHSLRKKQQTEAMCISRFNFFLSQSLFSFATVVVVVVGVAHSIVTDITKGPPSDTSSSVHNDTHWRTVQLWFHTLYTRKYSIITVRMCSQVYAFSLVLGLPPFDFISLFFISFDSSLYPYIARSLAFRFVFHN